jgi:hypothetical protein
MTRPKKDGQTDRTGPGALFFWQSPNISKRARTKLTLRFPGFPPGLCRRWVKSGNPHREHVSSALPLKADSERTCFEVCFVPKPEVDQFSL